MNGWESVSKMAAYNVSSWMLNPSIPYHTYGVAGYIWHLGYYYCFCRPDISNVDGSEGVGGRSGHIFITVTSIIANLFALSYPCVKIAICTA